MEMERDEQNFNLLHYCSVVKDTLNHHSIVNHLLVHKLYLTNIIISSNKLTTIWDIHLLANLSLLLCFLPNYFSNSHSYLQHDARAGMSLSYSAPSYHLAPQLIMPYHLYVPKWMNSESSLGSVSYSQLYCL